VACTYIWWTWHVHVQIALQYLRLWFMEISELCRDCCTFTFYIMNVVMSPASVAQTCRRRTVFIVLNWLPWNVYMHLLVSLLYLISLMHGLASFKIYIYIYIYVAGRSVGIATGYGLDGPGIESRWGRDFSHTSRPALGLTQPPAQWVPGLSRG
jgi:hypothetical protein